jgi:hypothetical protein
MAPEERSVAEVMINGKMEPSLIEGGQLVKTLSIGFLADLEEDWRAHGKKVFPVLREKHPQAYFGGLVALSKVIKWDAAETEMFDKTLSPEEIMDKLEQPSVLRAVARQLRASLLRGNRCLPI